MWYYVSDQQERVAVPDGRLPILVASGVIQPTTLVWRKGMASWVSCGEVQPSLFLPPASAGSAPAAATADPPAAGEAGTLHELTLTLRRYSGWMQVSGGLHMVIGIAAAALATTIGIFAMFKPVRIEMWRDRLPDDFRFLLTEPLMTIGVLVIVAAISLMLGEQLVSGALRIHRAGAPGNPGELRHALRSIGRFFQVTVLSVVLALLVAGVLALYHYRRDAAPKPPPDRKPPGTISL